MVGWPHRSTNKLHQQNLQLPRGPWHTPEATHTKSTHIHIPLSFWRLAANVDPLFWSSKLKTFRKVSITTKQTHNGRRESTSKQHKSSDTHTEHDTTQASPIGDDLDPQFLILIGEEEYKQEPDGNDLSEKERNSFLDTDIRKSLDDKLQFVTGSLPKFEHQHALVSSQLLSDIDRIEDSKEKTKLFNTSESL